MVETPIGSDYDFFIGKIPTVIRACLLKIKKKEKKRACLLKREKLNGEGFGESVDGFWDLWGFGGISILQSTPIFIYPKMEGLEGKFIPNTKKKSPPRPLHFP